MSSDESDSDQSGSEDQAASSAVKIVTKWKWTNQIL